MGEQLNEVSSHEHSKGKKVKASQLLRQPFVVAGQAPEPRCPTKAAFYYPSAGQEYKPSLGFGQFHHFQPDALLLCSLGCFITCVTLIHKRYLHCTASHFLDLLSNLRHLRSVPIVSCG